MTGQERLDRAAELLGDRGRRNVPIGPLTTYRVGGPAALFCEVSGADDLGRVRRAVRDTGIPVLVVGRGSNLLVADEGFPGLALILGESFAFVEVDGTEVRAGAAASLPVLSRRTAAAGLTGLEWAVGVPGSVGGGVRMNAGGHGSDMAATLVAARVYDLGGDDPGPDRAGDPGPEREVAVEDLGLSYRRSALTPCQIVTEASFSLNRGDRAQAEARIAEIVRWRREHQPGGPNAGSVFTNPPNDAAGRLVEAAGLKGFRSGTAWVSPKHSNFFQVEDQGSANDVRDLIDAVARIVHARTGVLLQPEVQLVGFQP